MNKLVHRPKPKAHPGKVARVVRGWVQPTEKTFKRISDRMDREYINRVKRALENISDTPFAPSSSNARERKSAVLNLVANFSLEALGIQKRAGIRKVLHDMAHQSRVLDAMSGTEKQQHNIFWRYFDKIADEIGPIQTAVFLKLVENKMRRWHKFEERQ